MVFSIATQKGGVGKTTTAITVAAALGRTGKRVLLIDMDYQANSSKILLPDYVNLRPEETVYQTIIDRQPLPVLVSAVPNVEVVPSHILLSHADMVLTAAKDHREARLKTALDPIKRDYAHVIIDCPPSLGWQTLNALTASDGVLIVVQPGYFELDSLVQIGKTLEEVREYFNPTLQLIGFLFTQSDPTVNSKTSLQVLRQTYTDQVLKTVIPRNTDIRDALMQRQDIFAYKPDAPAAFAYQKLIKELGL